MLSSAEGAPLTWQRESVEFVAPWPAQYSPRNSFHPSSAFAVLTTCSFSIFTEGDLGE